MALRDVGATGLALVQLAPVTPVMEKEPVPLGGFTPVAPTTVAVKVKVSPRFAVAVEVVMVSVGASLLITTVAAVDGPCGM